MSFAKEMHGHPYQDILTKEYQKSVTRKQMPASDRAAQFSPFSALVGYDDAISETGRLTDERMEQSEEMKSLIDHKLQLLLAEQETRPTVSVLYFVPDNTKSGGKYQTISGTLVYINTNKSQMILENDIIIPIHDIVDIHSKSLSFPE